MAASFAVERAAGYRSDGATFAGGSDGISQKAVLIRNIVLGSEFMFSHIIHFYGLAALDYVMGPPMSPWIPYFGDPTPAVSAALATSGWDAAINIIDYPSGYQNGFGYYHTYLKPGAIGAFDPFNLNAAAASTTGVLQELDEQKTIWSKVIADYVLGLHMQRKILSVGAQFAGGLPTFRSLVMGGVAVDATSATIQNWITNYKNVLYGADRGGTTASPASATVLHFIKNNYLPLVNIVAALYPQYDNPQNGGSGWGAGYGNFLGYGVFNSHLTGAYSLTSEGSMVTVGGSAPYNPFTDFTVNVNSSTARRFHNRGYVYGATSASSGTLYSPTGLTENTPSATSIPDFHKRIVEVVDYSWYNYYDSSGNAVASAYKHPWDGYTDPVPNSAYSKIGVGSAAYTWAKGPRVWNNYPNSASPDLKPMQVGPLARMWVTGLYRQGMTFDNTLTHGRLGFSAATVKNLLGASPSAFYYAGNSVMDRHRARALECYLIAIAVAGWLEALNDSTILNQNSYTAKSLPANASGFGLHEAPRGALGHWLIADASKRIQNWQSVVPSTWFDSPKDVWGNHGPLEQSILNPTITASSEMSVDWKGNRTRLPLEVPRVIHSYDPCLACTVHVVERNGDKKEVRK